LKRLLTLICLFAIVAGMWLGVMENILRHDGYAARSAIAAFIAIQGSATLLFLWLNRGGSVLRILVMAGAAAIMLLGASATLRILRAQHFEGFVLIIGLALLLQGALTLAALMPNRVESH